MQLCANLKNMRTLPVLLLLILQSQCATAHNLRPGKDYALFFAVDDYRSNKEFDDLRNPINDARAIAHELSDVYAFTSTVYENPTQQKVIDVLQDWIGKSFEEDAQLFIFFSGHGTFRDLTKKGYFVPHKAKAGDYGEYLELTDIGNIVTQISCNHILLAVDACYSGTIDQEIAFKGRRSLRRPNESLNSERDRLLNRQLHSKSRLLITSGGKERTPDGNTHSPFAGAILEGLREAYTNGDGLFIFPDLLSQLERVSPRPHSGHLIGHENGGFAFVAKDITTDVTIAKEYQMRGDTMIDLRDQSEYQTQIMKDGNRWMIQNLNYETKSGSYCYEDKPSNCQKFGRLYQQHAARVACPVGWHPPGPREWDALFQKYRGIWIEDVERFGTTAGFELFENEFAIQYGSSGNDYGLYSHSDPSSEFLSDAWGNQPYVYQFTRGVGMMAFESRKTTKVSVRCILD